ncbi:MAG: histidine triad nucleotide-binding protein [Micrococcales bacterium]|nr:histidine triad nucleotide-binding protein [Micrococcales bacterium]
MSDCLFCGIAAGDIPADVIYRDEDFVVFRDIVPTAPTHILVIPVQHHENIAELANADVELAGRFVQTATTVAQQEGVHEGFRLVTNTGDEGGQSVRHVHLHVLGGRQLGWPAG